MAIFSGSERLPRLAFRLAMIAWLPYALLDLLGGSDIQSSLAFLGKDFSVHTRFLIAVPVFILARKIIYWKGSIAVRHFLRSELLRDDAQRSLAINTLEKITRFFQSKVYFIIPAAGVLVLLILRISLLTKNWQMDWLNSEQNPSRSHLAELWLLWAGLPIYQYLLIDWTLRVGAWSLMLWKFSRLDLLLNPLHPDGRGGLAFLNSPQIAFAPLCFATAAVLAADQRGYFQQASLPLEPILMIALTVLIPCLLLFLGPLLFFTPALFMKKDPLLLADAQFGGVITKEFQRRWIDIPTIAESSDRTALDRTDLSAFTDYITIFASATRMKVVLIDKLSLIPFLVATLIPLFALLLTRLPLKEIFQLVAKTAL
jgi:hypothetical protein